MNFDPQYALALHTTTPELGLAVSNFQGDTRCQVWDLGREMSSHLHTYLAEFIQPQIWSDFAFLAVARGPGGFTGTRIGVVTARTLAQQLDIPLFAVSTLAAIAWSVQSQLTASEAETLPDIAVQMQAQRGEIFVGIYKVSATQGITTLLPDSVMTVESWIQTLATWPTAYHLIKAEGSLGASVSSILELAQFDWQQGLRPYWSEALPFYGQHPVTS